MPQKRPAYFPGGYYHIYNRGSHRAMIFLEPDNYLFVLRQIKIYLIELDLSIIAYCLMPNHYHLLIRQNGNQPATMLSQRVFNSYSKAYNKKYEHSGTLFEGPYRVKPIVQTSHLLQLCRYVHANPVKDGLVSGPQDWPYSNYQEWIGVRKGTLVDCEFVSLHFPTPIEYIQFVSNYLQTLTLPDDFTRYIKSME